ncbi:MAG: hypothetical protein KGM42_06475 [Hyphomicrobiales bacterium]|nr:hypothetical protein [Hyphomicrobiales bacterium]
MRGFLFAAALVAGAQPASAFSNKFDGVWTVDVRTTVGDCQPEIEGAVTIEGGRVVASSGADIAVWGYVEDSGDVSARFTQGQAVLRASGKARAAAAGGAWSSNTNYCGGVWSARREK